MAVLRRKGFSLIEIMIVVAIVAILILISLWAYHLQLLKGRDARRKADLAKWQRILEDYVSDSVCYPEGLVCGPTSGTDFEGYLSEIPCDPINNTWYNYMYTYQEGEGCNKWYKIYTKLENEDDPIITQVGCEGGCGPSNNYNYWVGSPNVTEVAQLPGEYWPFIPGASPPSGGTLTPSPGITPTPSPSPSPGVSPSPGTSPTPSPSPTPTCVPPSGPFPWCWPGTCYWCPTTMGCLDWFCCAYMPECIP